MRTTVLLNKRGVTLVEVMISLVILLFVFMGLIQVSVMSIDYNLRNSIRDEAVKMAADYMSRARAIPIDTLTAVQCTVLPAAPVFTTVLAVETRNLRGITQQFNITRNSCFTDATRNNATVTVTVTYTLPREANQNTQTVNSVVRR